MTLIILSTKQCKCGEKISGRTIDIKEFRKEMFTITENDISRKWKCWKCKEQPKVGEKWGISINNSEKNRLFCPGCAGAIANLLKFKEG